MLREMILVGNALDDLLMVPRRQSVTQDGLGDTPRPMHAYVLVFVEAALTGRLLLNPASGLARRPEILIGRAGIKLDQLGKSDIVSLCKAPGCVEALHCS